MRGMPGCNSKRDALRGHRILLVDDDDDIRACVADVLGLHGAQVTTARSGNEGFLAFCRERPDVVVSDLCMPDGDGFDLIRSIRAQAPADGGLTAAIAFSAADNLKAALLAGYHAFIVKPFEISELLAIVTDFQRPRADERLAPTWTMDVVGSRILIKLRDHFRSVDMQTLMSAVAHHLDEDPVDVIVDLRQLTSFAPSVGSIGERAL